MRGCREQSSEEVTDRRELSCGLKEGGIVMTKQEVMYLRRLLFKRRQEVFDRLRQLESGWQALGERESELEEEAQKVDLTSLFDQLDARGKEEIEEIDLALRKMAVGDYGICESCQKRLPLQRLETLPAARLCSKCARQFEEQHQQLPPAQEIIAAGQLPPEYQELTDAQLQTLILEYLRADDRIDLEELKISLRRGIVYLEGRVPSEIEHQIILQTLTDVMGLTAIIDHLHIDELTWEREDRTPGTVTPSLSEADRLFYNLENFTEDVVEAQEEEIPYNPADRPLPEKE